MIEVQIALKSQLSFLSSILSYNATSLSYQLTHCVKFKKLVYYKYLYNMAFHIYNVALETWSTSKISQERSVTLH